MQIAGVDFDTLEFENIGSWPNFLKYSIVVLAGLLTIGLGYFLYLGDVVSKLNAQVEERERLQENFAQVYNQVVNLDIYRKQVETVKKTLSSITQQLPTSNEESKLIAEISQQATTVGLQFRSIKPELGDRKGFYIEQPIALDMIGGYHSFGEFVGNLSRLERIITLHDFSIKNTGKGADKLEINLIAKSYWIPEETAPLKEASKETLKGPVNEPVKETKP